MGSGLGLGVYRIVILDYSAEYEYTIRHGSEYEGLDFVSGWYVVMDTCLCYAIGCNCQLLTDQHHYRPTNDTTPGCPTAIRLMRHALKNV